MGPKIARAELEKQNVELARKYVETHDPKFEKRYKKVIHVSQPA